MVLEAIVERRVGSSPTWGTKFVVGSGWSISHYLGILGRVKVSDISSKGPHVQGFRYYNIMFKFKINSEEEFRKFEESWLQSNKGFSIKKNSIAGSYPKFLGSYVDPASKVLYIEPIRTININDWKS